MMRGFRGSLLLAGLLTLLAASASAQAIGSIFGKVTDASGGVLPGVTVTVAGPSLQQPLVAVTTATGDLSVPERADRHVHRHVRAERLQEGHSSRTS